MTEGKTQPFQARHLAKVLSIVASTSLLAACEGSPIGTTKTPTAVPTPSRSGVEPRLVQRSVIPLADLAFEGWEVVEADEPALSVTHERWALVVLPLAGERLECVREVELQMTVVEGLGRERVRLSAYLSLLRDADAYQNGDPVPHETLVGSRPRADAVIGLGRSVAAWDITRHYQQEARAGERTLTIELRPPVLGTRPFKRTLATLESPAEERPALIVTSESPCG